jgi:hypothetical protein
LARVTVKPEVLVIEPENFGAGGKLVKEVLGKEAHKSPAGPAAIGYGPAFARKCIGPM